jgi:AmmeMemoRadiSam system protein A
LGFFPHSAFELDAHAQRLLLQSVQDSLRVWQEQKQRRAVPPQDEDLMLASHLGAFVTVYVNGELRGCIGDISGREPLSRLVPRLALSAALDDARFEPLSERDPQPEGEISILTPLKRIPDRSAFVLNKHGALLKSGLHRGLFLPQVAFEMDWDEPQFFAALAHKAGVSEKVYDEPGTELFVFRAQQVR